MPQTIYLIRHGQSEFNVQQRHQGWSTGNPLTSDGLYQAEKAGRFLKKRTINHIFASPLVRTQQTAQIISKHVSAPITTSHHLKDYRRSKSHEGLLKSEFIDLPSFIQWKKMFGEDPTFSLPDGESRDDFRDRLEMFAQECEAALEEKDSVLIVTHNDPLVGLIRHWSGETINKDEVVNCSLYAIDLETKTVERIEY
jgi:broad specificity phosphatase PhoE